MNAVQWSQTIISRVSLKTMNSIGQVGSVHTHGSQWTCCIIARHIERQTATDLVDQLRCHWMSLVIMMKPEAGPAGLLIYRPLPPSVAVYCSSQAVNCRAAAAARRRPPPPAAAAHLEHVPRGSQ